MLALRKAYRADDLEQAATYLDLRYLTNDTANIPAEELLRKLVIVWSRNHILDLSTLSDEPEGHSDDGLPGYRDLIGTLKLKSGPMPIYIQRIPDKTGNKV